MTAMLMTSSTVRRLRTSRPSTRRTSVLFSMNTTAMLRPILSLVRSEKIRAPLPSRVMKTAGDPVCWSIPDAASMMESPVSMSCRTSSTGRPLRSW